MQPPRTILRLATLALAAVIVPVTASFANTTIWLEGEQPTRAELPYKAGGWGRTQFLSEQSWLHASLSADEADKKVPQEGSLIEYDFSVEKPGRYEVWNRIGLEFVRSPFQWRIDRSEWKTIEPEALTSDLMDLDLWCEVAWIKMGDADLPAGRHTLQIRVQRRLKEVKKKERTADGKETEVVSKVPDNLVYASDCLCLYQGTFQPNGKFKPGADWQSPQDRQAAEKTFAVEGDETPLDGLWQVCRYDEQEVEDRTGPTRALPDADAAYWMAIPVPGNKFEVKPELRFCHRFVYRTRIDVPANLAGHAFLLRFPSLNMIASVHVNGQFCGWTKAMYALWDCDVTRAIRPGQTNEICVAIKDSYYAISPKKYGKSCRMGFNIPVDWMGGQNWIGQFFDFPIASREYGGNSGILQTPSFVVAGGVYAADVFARPSVQGRELGLEITLRNPGSADRKVKLTNEVVPAAGGKAEKTFAPRQLSVPAGGEQIVRISEAWENPKLWWPDDPNLYQVVTTVTAEETPADVRRTTFGFRQWQWDGPQFKLNGVRWQLWADCTLNSGGKDPEAAIARWRETGQNMWRFWGRRFGGLAKKDALDLMDARGVVVRRSGIFDGQGANYLHGLADHKELFDNWIVQLTAQVREERNHPSILIWSLENEITFINSRNLGMSQKVEPEIARAAKVVMAVDPTRPVMVDGGNCLIDQSLPVNGVHYEESFWRDYPDEAYTLAKAYVAHEKPVLPTWGTVPWQLMPDRPIFMGESYFVRGNNPSAFAQFGGEGCFAGWGPATRVGAGLLAKMLAEGYRWHGVAAQHFWFGDEDATLHHNSWKPVCVLCRQWNWTFAGGSPIERTLKVLNNTRFDGPLDVACQLTLEGKEVAGGKKTYRLAPGATRQDTIHLQLPPVTHRTAGEFVLTASRGGKEVFREVKQIAVIDPNAGPKPNLSAGQLAVLDPHGAVKARLHARGIPFSEFTGPDDVPPQAKVVVVGNDALSPRQATDPRWLGVAARGQRLLMLDQAHPLEYLAIPADLAATDYVGRVAFAENLEHPIFDGLAQQDFFTWSGDHVVYRNVYKKATRGAVSLAHCDEQLGYSAIAECPVNDGLMVLCQMVVGEKLATDPVAQRLFDNLLAYCNRYALVEKSTALVMAEESPAAKLLADSGLKFDRAADVLSAIGDGKHQIVVFDATPASLKALADAADRVKAFTASGGWLMAWGLTPEGLADFNKLVGVGHVLRPFEMERVTLPAIRDPLLSGLTVRDVTLETAQKIFPWSGDRYLAHDEFSYVVDLDDIAPFCELPGAKAGDHAAAKAAAAGWARNMVNGLTSADAWKLIHYLSTDNATATFSLPAEEEIRGLSLILNTHYAKATKVHLYFDDDPSPVVLTTQPNGERQDFDLAPRKAKRVTVKLAEFDQPGVTTGIDNLWLYVARSEAWHQKVKPLLNIGALVKYPMGRGGLVLNQILVKPSEEVPENAQKKRTVAAALLRNLHATFSGGRVLTAANLKFQPLPLNEQCNQYLGKDRGWLNGRYDLTHLPVGQQELGGVTYLIRDFRTSPVFSCVMLAGPGAKGNLPAAVDGLKADCKADVLYFLHAFHRTGQWRGRKGEAPPVLFQYIVHYADGQTAEVPVRYGQGADHWIAEEPAGLPDASVAWAAPFPDDETKQAVVYQLPWNNPRPNVPITTIDLHYGPEGSRWGVPALLAITAASRTD